MNINEKIEVTGMTCNHCVMRVEKALKSLSGVQSATVNLDSKLAVVEYDSDKADTVHLLAAIEGVGYKGKKI